MQSRFGEDDLCSRKTVSMRLEALAAENSARMDSSRSGTMEWVVTFCIDRMQNDQQFAEKSFRHSRTSKARGPAKLFHSLLNPTSQQQNDQDQKDQAYPAAGAITPARAVRPSRQRANKE
jgi:hypothetical protein